MNDRRIGLGGAVATLVGYVIGASIFVLPAELLPSTGAGVVLAYLIAAIPAVFTCIVSAVLGNAFPVSGASYVSVRDTLSPRIAFLTAWLIVVAAAIGAALVAYGLADYASYFWPSLSPRWCALIVVGAFILLNLTSVTVAVAAQGAMVVLFVIVIAIFSAGGLVAGDWSRVSPLAPHGLGSVLTGAVAAYFSYAGLQVLIDIGGEVRDPQRTIPRALALSFTVVLLLYLFFVLAVVLLSGDANEAQPGALVGRLAERHFGPTLARGLVLSALLAAATSIHGILFTQARDVNALALDGRLPSVIASPPGAIPRPAVVLLGALALLATAVGASIREYAVTTAMCMMAVQGVLGVAALRLPARAPDAWRASSFQLGPTKLMLAGGGLIVISALFFVLAALQQPVSLMVFAVIVVAGVLASSRTASVDTRRATGAGGGLS
ncbi:MAG: APC family permease [Gemmatimonadaceae bacterium]